MDEFFKALSNFLARDLVFIIGGGMVVTSFLYVFGLLDRLPSDTPVIFHLLGAGIAYVIGYALQEGFSLFRLVRTTPPISRAWWIVRFLYWLFTRHEWRDIQNIVDEIACFEDITQRIENKDQKAQLERIIVLKQIGTTIGPCAIVSSIIIIFRYFRSSENFDLSLSISAFLIGILFIGLGWVKLAEQAQYLSRHRQQRPT